MSSARLGLEQGWKRTVARFHPVLLLVSVLAAPASAADAVAELLRQVHWGETSQDLLKQFGAAATQLRKGLDFGDGYVDVVNAEDWAKNYGKESGSNSEGNSSVKSPPAQNVRKS